MSIVETRTIATTEGLPIAQRVRIASTFAARLVGLLKHRALEKDEGMLLAPGGSVHTVGMRFAIDVVFLDASLKVLRVVCVLRPWRAAVAPRTTRFVLELAAGQARTRSVHPGMRLQVGHRI